MKKFLQLTVCALLIAGCYESAPGETWEQEDLNITGAPTVVLERDYSVSSKRQETSLIMNSESWCENYENNDVDSTCAFLDTNEVTHIGGEDALRIHGLGVPNARFGVGVEFQLDLDHVADMRREDFRVTFDIYVPESLMSYNPGVRFAFYEWDYLTPIYSRRFDIPRGGEWFTVTSTVSKQDGSIDYSGFKSDPTGWVFQTMRIMLTAKKAFKAMDMEYYVANMRVYRP
ncbi:MAG: hypothetical protein JXR76_25080 [Deltaproteobacteria bacterium]|nr:hypothetical protein [Deltaproteobacteria bacterium]